MSNALLPTLSSHLHYGNNEIQLENFKACMQIEDLLNQFPSNGLFMESTILNNETQTNKGDYTMSHSHFQSLIQQGSLLKDTSHQSLLPSKRPSDSLYDEVRGNGRKRPFEAIDDKITNMEPKWHDTSHKIPRNKLNVPVRRNQKLSDKITTLQKLVSPFGKTDTASVLQEAFLYIKLLQERIRNLFQMLSSYNKAVDVHHIQMKKEVGLRSKGLCLVPISLTQKVTMEDQFHRGAVSSRFNYNNLPKTV